MGPLKTPKRLFEITIHDLDPKILSNFQCEAITRSLELDMSMNVLKSFRYMNNSFLFTASCLVILFYEEKYVDDNVCAYESKLFYYCNIEIIKHKESYNIFVTHIKNKSLPRRPKRIPKVAWFMFA